MDASQAGYPEVARLTRSSAGTIRSFPRIKQSVRRDEDEYALYHGLLDTSLCEGYFRKPTDK